MRAAIARVTAVVLMLSASPFSEAAQPSSPDLRAFCQTLDTLSTAAWRVDTHDWMSPTETAPEHCLLRLTLDPRSSGVEDLTYGTGIELRLPAGWNGRLLFQGGGGLDGVLNAAFGNIGGAASALMRGFAVVSSDGGHRGRSAVDARFGVDQQAKLQAWVEEGQAPDRIPARGKAFPGRTRPLCPYPKVARYVGGDVEDERSFACQRGLVP